MKKFLILQFVLCLASICVAQAQEMTGPELEALIDSYSASASEAYSKSDMQNASDLFNKAADLALTNTDVAKKKAYVIYNAGIANHACKSYNAAKKYFSEAVRLEYYNYGDVFYYLSTCEEKVGNKELAFNWLERGIVLFPLNALIGINLGIFVSLDKENRFNKVLGLLEKAEKNDSDNVSFYTFEASFRCWFNDYDGAISAYKKAILIKPEESKIYKLLGAVYHEKAVSYYYETWEDEIWDERENIWKYYNACFEALEKSYELCESYDNKVEITKYTLDVYNYFYKFLSKINTYYEKENIYTYSNFKYKDFIEKCNKFYETEINNK